MSFDQTAEYTCKTMTDIRVLRVCGCREEWQWLQALSSLEEAIEMDNEEQSAPHRLLQDLRSAIKDLMAHINIPGNQVRVNLILCESLSNDIMIFCSSIHRQFFTKCYKCVFV